MATTIDDNAADEKSDKSIWRLLNIQLYQIIHYFSAKKLPAAIFQPIRPENLLRQFIFHISKSFISIS